MLLCLQFKLSEFSSKMRTLNYFYLKNLECFITKQFDSQFNPHWVDKDLPVKFKVCFEFS